LFRPQEKTEVCPSKHAQKLELADKIAVHPSVVGDQLFFEIHARDLKTVLYQCAQGLFARGVSLVRKGEKS
jgi:hypothetical protein